MLSFTVLFKWFHLTSSLNVSIMFFKGYSLTSHLSLNSAHASTLGIHRLVGEPEGGVYVLDVADRVAIFDVRSTHPFHLLPQAKVQLLLQTHHTESWVMLMMSIKQSSTLSMSHLWGAEAEGRGLDICFLFVHQQEPLIVHHAEIFAGGHVTQPKRLTPANVTAAPPERRHETTRIISHTCARFLKSEDSASVGSRSKEKVAQVKVCWFRALALEFGPNPIMSLWWNASSSSDARLFLAVKIRPLRVWK